MVTTVCTETEGARAPVGTVGGATGDIRHGEAGYYMNQHEKHGLAARVLTTHDITFSAAGIALLAVSAWVTIPMGPVPFTLQTMALAFVVTSMTRRRALITVGGYLLIGAVGVPVFSGMRGGIAQIAGPTGGFLLGFLVGTLVAEAILAGGRGSANGDANGGTSRAREIVAVFALLAISYLMGWAQLMVVAKLGPVEAFGLACAPFIVPDVVKMLVGSQIAHSVRMAVPSLGERG